MPITTVEEKAQRRLKVKGRSTLMIGISNEYQLKFNSIKDAKQLLEGIKKRLGGNAATKKTQKNLLKQQYKNFTASSLEMLNQTFDRLLKLVSQLELLDEKISQEDVNQNLLRSLSPEWNTHAVVWRNKADLDTMSIDDLYKNLKKIGRRLTINGNEKIGFDKSNVECYNCHKRRYFARECRAPKNQDNMHKESSRRSVPMETSNSITLVSCDGLGGYDWSDQAEEGPNYALMAFLYLSSDSKVSNDSTCSKSYLETIKLFKSQNEQLLKDLKKSELMVLEKFENASKSLNKLIECQIVENYKKGLGCENYNAVPPPYTRNFMPSTSDSSISGLDEFANKPVADNCKAKSSEEETKVVRKNDDAPIIKEWVLDNEEGNVSQPKTEKKTVRPSIVKKEFVKSKQQEKTVRKTVKQVEHHRKNTHRNMSYLTEYEEIDGGYVAFGGNPKGGKITRKVLLRVPRKNNIYSVDLKNIVPKGGFTRLFAKATSDESKLWHRRLGHLNFKTMNKLVKGNLVRGLPSKLFENDQTCIACQKGKQHRASCKPKIENSISLPLHLLHMDLFGLTFIKSLMKKMYCLVVTDDYSRFTWVFFLTTRDETSVILKSFITRIKNLVDHKVKVIRCDNGTEFKNREMNQFCEMKGILRQFGIARTLEQNRVVERRDRILIEAARTMLADSKLPPTFWAEAVNTTCYVQNRVLVVNPHNKTSYELFHDHYDKFDGKADESFFVGYSLNSKVFRVFNSGTRIVEENLHIRFSKNTPNVVGSGPDWLFDIDSLTRTMNYKPAVASTQSNSFPGIKASDNAGQARKETEPVKDYILLPLWTVDLPFSKDSKSSHDDGSKP
nr:putative ribonuclease H-like domain-containing protein [Tanacetum cinerariifolium]